MSALEFLADIGHEVEWLRVGLYLIDGQEYTSQRLVDYALEMGWVVPAQERAQ